MARSTEAPLVSPHHRLPKTPAGVKFKLGRRFMVLKLLSPLYVSQRSEKRAGALKERREKRHTFLTFKGNTSLTYKEVKDFSPQTYDNHFDRAFQL